MKRGNYSGTKPSWRSMLNWSMTAQWSVTLPLAKRPMWISSQLAILFDGGMPMKSPLIVPLLFRHRGRTLTRLPPPLVATEPYTGA